MEDVFLIDTGCYWVGEDDRDFLFWEDMSAIELAPLQNTTEYFYNQATLLGGKLRSFCTVMSPIHILSSTFDYKLSIPDFEDLWKFAQEKYNYKEGRGNYLNTWVACAVTWWNNKFPERQVVYFQIPQLISNDVEYVSEKGYHVASGYRGDTNYNLDVNDDGVVKWTRFWNTYWHAVPIKYYEVETKVNDSYDWRKYNTYWIEDLLALRNNWVFFPTAYIIVPDPNNDIRRAVLKKKDEMNTPIRDMIFKNSVMWHSIGKYPELTQVKVDRIRKWLNEVNNALREVLR